MAYQPVLELTLQHALRYLDHLDRAPVAATAGLDELRRCLTRPLAEQGVDAEQVIEELVSDVEGGLLGSAGGRFFGWVIGGTVPAALAADWLTSTWDQNAGLYATAPAEAVIEEVCGRWLKELLGLPMTASFALVTGCLMAHVTCLAAARNAVLQRRGWDVEQKGLSGAPPIRIISSDQKHGSFDCAVRLIGLGLDNIMILPANQNGRLEAGALRTTLEQESDRPTIVLLQAGDLNMGAYDPFDELIPIAHEHGAWVHVDGAFGLWAAAHPDYRHLLKGSADADSWSTDGHKWLNVPYDCGYAFVAHPDAHRSAMSYHANYLVQNSGARDEFDWNPEWSRRGRGVATYAAIRQLGRQGIADLVGRTCRHARALATRIGALHGAELVWEPQINQGLVRFPDMRAEAADADHDRRTEEVMKKILASGEAFFTGSTWRGKRCMRISVCSWQTTESDVERSVKAVERALAS